LADWPTSIREINDLDVKHKEAIYQTLLPECLFTHRADDNHLVQFRCPAGSRALEITVKRSAADFDPMFYLHMTDTFNNQLLVLLAVVNDLDSPRFNIDVDEQGNPTHFGTAGRNIAAETAAMAAGLAPGQVRRGLRLFRRLIPVFETFVRNLQHPMFLIEPLAYHNAILFERYGFGYIRGQQEMEQIHLEFQPEGKLFQALKPDNPFRQAGAATTVRGRSWAVHDGILGHPFTGFQMYKLLGKDLGINTFPNAQW
jgi:hypothetical protein